MERFTISKSEKQTIYEIYRACRLCGAGGGYRMPIIQNIVDLDSCEVELRQKIQECLQLEVRPDDRMPPLICELCVDKVNDFYHFFELTRQTNIRTRTRLGLPLHVAKKGEPEPSDCILGVTEPVYVEDDEPVAKKGKAGPRSSKKIKKEPETVTIKLENSSSSSSRSSSLSRPSRARAAPAPAPAPAPASAPAPAPAPARARRRQEPPREKEQNKEKKERKNELDYLMEDNLKYEDSLLLVPRSMKRLREEPPRPAPFSKRSRAAPKEPVKEPTPPPAPRPRPGPKSRKAKAPAESRAEPAKLSEKKIPAPKTKAKPPETPAKQVKEPPKPQEEPPPKAPYKCLICDVTVRNLQGYSRHMLSHVPNFTKLANACNPCGKWFVTTDEAATHHRYHRSATFPYHCRRCFEDYSTLQLYNEHIDKGQCTPDDQPGVTCEDCSATFPTDHLRAGHKCPGRENRSPAGKCSKCSSTYASAKSLKKHESQCQRRKRELIADPDVLRRLKPMQVRILRCDGLLERAVGDHYDVARVRPNYGLAKNYVYPYLKLTPVKPEPLHRDSMVTIPLALKEVIKDRYTHWDSEDSDSETVIRRVPTLSTLAIKILFSKNLLGKVPRKRKRVKNENFENENDFSMSSDINDIISSLSDDLGKDSVARKDLTAKIKDIIGCMDDDDFNGVNETVIDESRVENDESTKENLESSECNDVSKESSNVEEKNVESSESNDNGEEKNHVEINKDAETDIVIENNDTEIDRVLDANDTNQINEENEILSRINNENEIDSSINDDHVEMDESTQKNNEDDSEKAAEIKEPEVSLNGTSNHEEENTFEDTLNNDNNSQNTIEEISKQIKESPIKHSIDNLIGEANNPDKYINEVISSIEDIINKNPRIDDKSEEVNGQTNEVNDDIMNDLNDIGEDKDKRLSDHDKITLDDLLPKEDRVTDLENISDDDFNFDA